MLIRDVENHDTSSFDDMLKFMLEKVDTSQSISSDERLQNTLQAVVGLCEDKGGQLREPLAEYCQEISFERQRYDPFVHIFNDALLYLKDVKVEQSDFRPASTLDILFCRNAEREIHGPHVGADDNMTKRKPDIILTSTHAASRVFRLGTHESKSHLVERLGQQPPGNFTWHEVLSAWEFKLHSKTLKIPPTPYDTALHGEYETMAVTSRTMPQKKDSRQRDRHKGVSEVQRPTRSSDKNLSTTALVKEAQKSDEAVQTKSEDQPAVLSSDGPSPGVQCALYGAEMLSRAPAVSHALVMLIQDSIFRIWWYDHQGAIQTTGIDFLKDLPRFLALLFALQRFELEDWGRVPEFDLKYPQEGVDPTTKIIGRMSREVQVYLAKHVYKTLGLKGRGTYVVESKCRKVGKAHPLNDARLVTKLLWADCMQMLEGEIVEHAIALDETIKDHMPQVVDEFQYDKYNTRTVREKLGIPLKVCAGADGTKRNVYRVLRVITMERLEHLHKLMGQEFVKGWMVLTQVHLINWRNGIQHKDISVNNLMYRCKLDKTLCAVLNDWDLSSVVTKENEPYSSFELTGTVPYMAIDLLSPKALAGKVRHLYRHDLESFIWVFLWVIHCCLNGEKLAKTPFEKWSTPDVEACSGAKLGFLREGYQDVKPTASWMSEYPIAFALIGYLQAAEAQQSAQKWAEAQRAQAEDRELELIEEEDLPVDVWKGCLSYVQFNSKCKLELHHLLDRADLKLE